MPGETGLNDGMATSAESDAALLRRTAEGDTSAFDLIVERHQGAVRRFLCTLGADDVDDVLDDVLQETFIAAWRSASGYQATGSVRSWLLSIARNVYRHHRRFRVDEPRSFVALDDLAERAGWGCDPAEGRRVAAALARDVLEHALAQVPREEREVLVLRELEGLSGEETAQLLQLTLPAMKSRLHRARLHLAAAVRTLEHLPAETGRDHVER